ncbi:hypothetical protein [Dokdonella soli]|uniref:Lipoprotein n=1 Tax=Dokdonella soli TaxID=529810 RepID=A0ABN1IB92_9GAMM
MKPVLKSAVLMTAALVLGGCVYGPDYGYVRGDGYYGDAYYGTTYYSAPYYYDYGPGYYGYGYGYPSFGLGIFYDDFHHHHHGHGWNGGGRWHGGRGSHH